MSLIQIVLFCLWMFVIPVGVGSVILFSKERVTLSDTYLAGWLGMFSLAFFMILPLMFLRTSHLLLVILYGSLTFAAAASGYGYSIAKKRFRPPHRWLKEHFTFFFVIAVLLLVFRIIYVCLYTSLDADDALYVGIASTDVANNSIFRVNPYTGDMMRTFPARYVLAPFPILLGVLSVLCGGLHPAILAHVGYPIAFFLLGFVILVKLGDRFFKGRPQYLGIFLVFYNVFVLFSGYSVYNSENFQLIRIWQGKAMLASVMIPILLYYGFTVMAASEEKHSWLMVFLTSVSCCLMSSLSIVVTLLSMGVFTVLGVIRTRRWKKLIYFILCSLPCLFVGITYIMIR